MIGDKISSDSEYQIYEQLFGSSKEKQPTKLSGPVKKQKSTDVSVKDDDVKIDLLTGFQEPDHIRKRQLRDEKKKARVIRGTGQFANIKGAPERCRDLFIYRVDKSTQDKHLKDHIGNNGFSVVKFDCISQMGSKYKSYRTTYKR